MFNEGDETRPCSSRRLACPGRLGRDRHGLWRSGRFLSRPARPAAAPASGAATAQYLANAAVLVTNGGTKVVFDPLFRNDFGSYERVPESMERALFAGAPPFDGLDAVFISHYHEDHFSAIDVLRLLETRPDLRLYAPAQAVAGMREIASARLDAVIDRVNAIALQYRDAPVSLEHGTLLIEAVRVPHSGWPARQQQVENIAFRVTLDTETTVVHLGDADASDAHFAHDGAYWQPAPDRRRISALLVLPLGSGPSGARAADRPDALDRCARAG